MGKMEFTFGIIRFDLVLCELLLGAHALLYTYIHPVRTHKVLDKIWWFQRLITSSPSLKTLFLNFISLLCIQYSPSGDWVHITALLYTYIHPITTHKLIGQIWWFQGLIHSSPSSKKLFLNFTLLICTQYSASGDWVHKTALLYTYIHTPHQNSQNIISNLVIPRN